ncbi:hypothetical protein Palpr_0403 [Paludibacter propionicigenes WB4]|uniref:Oligosaccharide repeat unit polymerase n=1 Tax=Paludibacter propionicigenes (strain DSM 17365 / JCM 13257 / WB4) TaxID=694427 RepID=E4T1G9_PALPW|nr:O-antigen polymerase [Paludibacter propionicigenes]ADQ78563.1 hypothetical protein Palpr_0403 [Paludibacter propionicigenes WB4]
MSQSIQESIYLIFSNVLFLIPLLYYLIKIKRLNELLYIFIIWFLFSIFSVLYNSSNAAYSSYKSTITLAPIIYIYVCFLITVSPLFKINSNNIQYIKSPSNLFLYIIYFISIIAYLPFIENIFHLLTSGFSNFGSIYESRDNLDFDPRAHMSFLGARFNSILIWMQFVTPSFLFIYLSKFKVNIIIAIGLIFAAFNSSILGLCSGSRGIATATILNVAYCYLLFKNFLPIFINKIIRLSLLFIGTLFVLGLFWATLSRFGDHGIYNSDNTILDWIYRYLGEGLVNFYKDGWSTTSFTNGQNSFYQLFGDKRNIMLLEKITHIRMYVFYTSFGDLLIDFGPFATLLILLSIAFLIRRISIRKGCINPFDLVYINLYSYSIFMGLFTFSYINSTYILIFSIIITYILKIQVKYNFHG